MTELIALFALLLLASLIVALGILALAKDRQERRETKQETTTSSFADVDSTPFHYEIKKTTYYMYDKPYKPAGWKFASDLLDDTRIPESSAGANDGNLEAFEDWMNQDEAAYLQAKRYKENIDRWEQELGKGLGDER